MDNNQAGVKWVIGLLILAIMVMAALLFDPDFIRNLASIIPKAPKLSENTSLIAIFLTGLFVGGLTCLAVQGGLLATTIAQREEEKIKQKTEQSGNATPILAFLAAKLVAYTLLGFLLGWFGQLFKLSLTAQIIMQFAVAVFMVGTALNLLNVHPIFRYFTVAPPRILTRLVRKQSKNSSMFAPAFLGAFTVFIPCGTTQAMMALSIGSQSPLTGAAILFAFVLGTSPLFFVLGFLATRLGDTLHQRFIRIAAVALILLAIFNANNALALSGSNFTLDNIFKGALSSQASQGKSAEAVTETTINIEQTGYSPSNFSIKAGAPITLRLVNSGGTGCTQAFTIPSLGIQKIIPYGKSDTITFTAPSRPGLLAFMCSMGMFRGIINVI